MVLPAHPSAHQVRALRDGETRSLLWHSLVLLVVAAGGVVVVVAATSILALDGRPANLAEANGSISPFNSKRTRRHRSLPVHRSILAVDIEGSTRRTNPVKGELRDEVYRLVIEALCVTGIDSQHYDPFTDRGDGLLVLLHPVDELPKPVLLSHLIPALAGLLAAYNSRIPPADQPRILRLRAVIHAGEVHRDVNGPFGDDLDVAFRLLDAPRFKEELKSATVPLALVASDYIYQSIIRHGYDGIDDTAFLPLVTVKVGDQRRRGWVHFPFAEGITVGMPTLPQAS